MKLFLSAVLIVAVTLVSAVGVAGASGPSKQSEVALIDKDGKAITADKDAITAALKAADSRQQQAVAASEACSDPSSTVCTNDINIVTANAQIIEGAVPYLKATATVVTNALKDVAKATVHDPIGTLKALVKVVSGDVTTANRYKSLTVTAVAAVRG
ncbi:MAG TPA: hypothetical protein VKR79_09530 [Gaiellaceae bacterium]|nr:hypothetical protein [Gaiellaceae bacterium]